jgi:hypothetical protein
MFFKFLLISLHGFLSCLHVVGFSVGDIDTFLHVSSQR